MQEKPAIGLRERATQQRAERIVDAARGLLRDQPEQRLTVQQIAERAEVAAMTVFNVIGTRNDIWAAVANRALSEINIAAIEAPGPKERALAIADAIGKAMIADQNVFRALLASWSQSGAVLDRDPTDELIACLSAAAQEGVIADGLDIRRLGQLLTAGIIGIAHQWAAGLISNRALRRRLRDQVSIVFAAASNAPVAFS